MPRNRGQLPRESLDEECDEKALPWRLSRAQHFENRGWWSDPRLLDLLPPRSRYVAAGMVRLHVVLLIRLYCLFASTSCIR